MKLCLLALLAWLCFLKADAQPYVSKIIPSPVSLQLGEGSFTINRHVRILIPPSLPGLSRLGRSLADSLLSLTGIDLPVVEDSSSPRINRSISMSLYRTLDSVIGAEGYRLSVGKSEIHVRANTEAGIFYGMQTLYQLLPVPGNAESNLSNPRWALPSIEITDYPRFAWRGLMLDVSRHFFTKDEVKGLIDEMARYKFNIFHWHLTDDDGWRIQIMSHPKLTSKGAWNVRRVGTYGSFPPPRPDEPADQGGFYTQDDIREVVSYAKDRFVDILPEIDIPGHSLAAVVSYPELSCTPDAVNYLVKSGNKILKKVDGKFVAQVDNNLCPSKEETYRFLDSVFTEVVSLFPFGYVHIGGDEVARNFWKENKEVSEFIDRQGLQDIDGLQSYFLRRVTGMLATKGRRVIGWDELLENDPPLEAVIMAWRGYAAGMRASSHGHEVIMTPDTHAYLSFMQADRVTEPPVRGTLRLKKSYEFNPLQEGMDPASIKGGQGSLWTEQVQQVRQMQYMFWPRALAISECLWSPQTSREWNGFVKRVEAAFPRFDVRGIRYATALYDPVFSVFSDARDSLQVQLSTEVEGLEIHYSFDNSHPDPLYPTYRAPLFVPPYATMLKVVTSRNGVLIGRQVDMPIEVLRMRLAVQKKL
jgi:hexosaminidase